MKEKTEEIDYIEQYKRIEKEFIEYLKSNYDFKNIKIKHKYEHTLRVVEIAEYIARDLDLDEEEVFVAKLIALFHDLGRFMQTTKYNSFEDNNTIDHGAYGADLLFKENLIREFLEESKYDSIIREGVFNHNKYEIETKRLTEQQLLHAKIIRDADKTDALYLQATQDTLKFTDYNETDIANAFISDKVYEDFMNEKTILNSDLKTYADKWLSRVAFVFGYYYTSGLKLLEENDYINIIKDKIEFTNEETINKVQNMFILVENCINFRISNNINF